MTTNGKPQPLKLVIVADPETGHIKMSAPTDHATTYGMLRAATDMVVNRMLKPEPERKVKTLDEVGIRSRRGR